MQVKQLHTAIYLFMATLLAAACSKMNDPHDPYLKRGETIYVGRVDSARVLAGNGRVLLRYWTSDPKAKRMVVYWNSRTDSTVLDIPTKLRSDSVDVIIAELGEFNYLFEMVTMTKELANRSIVFQKGGAAYGGRFQASLTERVIKSKAYVPASGQLTLVWLGAVEKAVACDITYTDKAGATLTKRVPITENNTVIKDVGGNVRYTTLFLPEANAIDTFSTPAKAVPLN
jgi:hypothetical protein